MDKKLILIGYWYSEQEPQYPHPKDLVNPEFWKEFTKKNYVRKEYVADYLDKATKTIGYRGFSACRICGERLGTCERTDGKYTWPDKLSHYIMEHDVILPLTFLDHMLKGNFQDNTDDWWITWGKRKTNHDRNASTNKPDIHEQLAKQQAQELADITDKRILSDIQQELIDIVDEESKDITDKAFIEAMKEEDEKILKGMGVPEKFLKDDDTPKSGTVLRVEKRSLLNPCSIDAKDLLDVQPMSSANDAVRFLRKGLKDNKK